MTRLGDFVDGDDDPDPPYLEREFAVPVPASAPTDGTAGWVVAHNRGRDGSRGLGYLAIRERGPDPSTPQGAIHYHVKTGGYPISESILDDLDDGVNLDFHEGNVNISKVFVAEADTYDLHEFTLRQYLEGALVTWNGDRQLSAPVEEATTWDGHANDAIPDTTLTATR